MRGTTVHCSIRLPVPLRKRLAVVAAAEQRSLSSVLVAMLDRGLAEKARELAVVRDVLDQGRERP
jgi:hypothetical protein